MPTPSSCAPASKPSSRCWGNVEQPEEPIASYDGDGRPLNYYVLVETYTQAMAIQENLREGGIPSRISPTPHAIQGVVGCGVAILLLPENVTRAKAAIEAAGLPYHSVVPLACQINPRRDRFV